MSAQCEQLGHPVIDVRLYHKGFNSICGAMQLASETRTVIFGFLGKDSKSAAKAIHQRLSGESDHTRIRLGTGKQRPDQYIPSSESDLQPDTLREVLDELNRCFSNNVTDLN